MCAQGRLGSHWGTLGEGTGWCRRAAAAAASIPARGLALNMWRPLFSPNTWIPPGPHPQRRRRRSSNLQATFKFESTRGLALNMERPFFSLNTSRPSLPSSFFGSATYAPGSATHVRLAWLGSGGGGREGGGDGVGRGLGVEGARIPAMHARLAWLGFGGSGSVEGSGMSGLR